MSDYIYLDYPSSTPIDPRVLKVMTDALANDFGNPANLTHVLGRRARSLMDTARQQVAHCIGAHPDEIFFTKGATESNNLAIFGIAKGLPHKKHFITTAIEHKAVWEPCRLLETQGYQVTLLPLDAEAQINYSELEKSITSHTSLVSLMWVNNEIGSLHDIERISEITKRTGVLFHSDATQAVGKVRVDVSKLNLHMLSLSSHKIYGPKGIGALYIRRDIQSLVKPLILGGGQECGLVSGTSNVPAIVGFGKACEILTQELENDIAHSKALAKEAVHFFKNEMLGVHFVSPLDHCVPSILNTAFEGVLGTDLICRLDNIALSAASACCSGSQQASHVLTGIGFRNDLVHNNIRMGIGRFTSQQQLASALAKIKDTVEQLRHQGTSPKAQNDIELLPEQVRHHLNDFFIIDVRSTEEYNGELGHIPGSILKTLDMQLDQFLKESCPTKMYLFVCRSGRRSISAVEMAAKYGYTKAYSLTGGMILWNQKALPVEHSFDDSTNSG